MALVQHSSLPARFKQQVDNASTYLIPFLRKAMPVSPGQRVLEVGCGEGGVLKAFAAEGLIGLGVDLSEYRIEQAQGFLSEEIALQQLDFVVQNVYDPAFIAAYSGHFDWVVLKDTIEHIPNQEQMIPHLAVFLKPGGKMFFGFPPWRMPFGGHQQVCKSKWLAFWPWVHLLPKSLYHQLLKWGKEPEVGIEELLELVDTGLSIKRFEKICALSGLKVDQRLHFLLNPIYSYKFGWKPVNQAKWVSSLPFLRDFITTAAWYVVSPDKTTKA